MDEIRAITFRNLDRQGFDGLDNAAKSRQAWPLRFTPAVSVSLIVIGLALQSPWWLAGMALVALSGALLPGGMLIDTLYNIGVRHLFRAPPLPPTPKPRQFSYLISTAFLSASAVLFYARLPVLGSVVGGLVAIAGTVLATTHWCLGSFYYRLILRARTLGLKTGPKPEAEAKVESRPGANADPLPVQPPVTPQAVKRVHELYEERKREDVRAVQASDDVERERRSTEAKADPAREGGANPNPGGQP